MVMVAVSPRSVAENHTLEFSLSTTSPMTAALGAIQLLECTSGPFLPGEDSDVSKECCQHDTQVCGLFRRKGEDESCPERQLLKGQRTTRAGPI